jgi:hypothetical protein
VRAIAGGGPGKYVVASGNPEGADDGGPQEDKGGLQMFIDWLIPSMEAFLMFESSLPKDTSEMKTRTPDPSKDNDKGPRTGKKKTPKVVGAVGEVKEAPVAGAIKTEMTKGLGKTQRKNCCFKCGSEEHGFFHCPRCNGNYQYGRQDQSRTRSQ